MVGSSNASANVAPAKPIGATAHVALGTTVQTQLNCIQRCRPKIGITEVELGSISVSGDGQKRGFGNARKDVSSSAMKACHGECFNTALRQRE
jgi:hypothetical protein